MPSDNNDKEKDIESYTAYTPDYARQEDRQDFGLALYQRLNQATYLQRLDVRIGDWVPQIHYCHDNVASWVKYNPTHKRVFGFVYFECFAVSGYVQFAPHSAVELEDGTLVDITPHNAEFNYPFLRHTGTEAEFAAIAAVGNLNIPLNLLNA